MPLLQSWPTITDDSGGGQDGTVLNKSVTDAIKASIEDQVYSATNPTVRPKDILDEVVTARGNKASLNARLAGVIDADGNILLPASAASAADVGTLVHKNLLPNSDFLLWTAGATSAPDYTVLSGTGATLKRVGTGESDTWASPYGDYGVQITYGSAAARLTWTVLSATDFARVPGFKGRKVAVGAWCQASVANQSAIVVDDGVTVTKFGTGGAGTYHPGDGTKKWLSGTVVISNSATKLNVYLEVGTAGAAYFGAVHAMFSNFAPADFVPCEMQKGVIHFISAGVLTTGTTKGEFYPGAPGIITDVQLSVVTTGPVGAALIIDVKTWDGAALTTMFTSGVRPRIADGGSRGGAVPDSTYARRCFSAHFGSAVPGAGGLITWDIAQVGSGTPGTDLIVEVRTRQYIRALEQFLTYSQL